MPTTSVSSLPEICRTKLSPSRPLWTVTFLLFAAKLAENLAKARDIAGITQKELAERTGIYQADISKIERGIANPSLSTLKRLADGMGMELQLTFKPR